MAETGEACLIAEACESAWPAVVPPWIPPAFQPLRFPVALSEDPHNTESRPGAHLSSWAMMFLNVSLEIFKDGIWSQPGVFPDTFPQAPSWSWPWWRVSHTPPSLCWYFRVCASGWQKGLPFRAGTLQSLRVWWKNETVLMELPYDSEHLLEGI